MAGVITVALMPITAQGIEANKSFNDAAKVFE